MVKVIMLDGVIINVGDWNFLVTEELVYENPWDGEGDAPESWDYKPRKITTINNPMPYGAEEIIAEVATSDKGRILLADDYYNLRADAYPSRGDQLDAIWKGGEAYEEMAKIVQSVKDRYPKPEGAE